MRKMTVTVGDLINALSKFPKDTPVFGYSVTHECDVCFDVLEFAPGPEFEESEDWDTGEPTMVERAPHYCQADSYVEEHWRENGNGSILYLREMGYRDTKSTNENLITLY